jgi:hypothetical protein
MMLGAVRKPVAHVFLPSPSEPLINPRASLREFAAVHLGKCASLGFVHTFDQHEVCNCILDALLKLGL